MPGERILVVDDHASLREMLCFLLQGEGYAVESAGSGEEALRRYERQAPDLVITDINMPGMSGLELMRELRARAAQDERDVEVVVITAHDRRGIGAEAIGDGAADYLTKPFDNVELRVVVRQVLRVAALKAENARLRKAVQTQTELGNLSGTSAEMARVRDLIRRVKDARINCLLQGESGTGKEMVARAIHYQGTRQNGPFIAVNCGAIAPSLVESELFGYKKGAFTGALRDKVGLIKAADKGTLFLDEVNSLPLPAQVTLLRAIQERRVTPVGDTREVEVDVRILAASNADLQGEVEGGRFREDLYYRLCVVQIDLPPLRTRREDIRSLAEVFVQRFAEEYGRPVRLTREAIDDLEAWDYPGNVRELQNIIERAVALSQGNLLRSEDLPERMRKAPPRVSGAAAPIDWEGVNLDEILSRTEQEWLDRALKETDGNKTRAAQLLGISFRSFRYRLSRFNMDTDEG